MAENNVILNQLTSLVMAVKEEELLKAKLLQLCMLPIQQRLIEIDRYLYENKGNPNLKAIFSILPLLKDEKIAIKIHNVLLEKDKTKMKTKLSFFWTTNKIWIILNFFLFVFLFYAYNNILFKKEISFYHYSINLKKENIKLTDIIHKEYASIISEKDNKRIIELCTNFLEKYPETDYSLIIQKKLINSLFKEKEYKKVIDMSNEFMEANESSKFYLMSYKIKSYLKLKQQNIAIKTLREELILTNSEKAKNLYNFLLAEIYSDLNNKNKAILYYSKLLNSKNYTKKAEVNIGIGDLYFKNNNLNEALKYYYQNIDKTNISDKLKAKTFFQIAKIYNILNKNQKSKEFADKALQLPPFKIILEKEGKRLIINSHIYIKKNILKE